MKITETEIEHQYTRVSALGWMEHFRDAARAYGWPASLLLAIGSRESNLNNIIGDKGNGFGCLQVDKRTKPDIVKHWQNVRYSIFAGVEILTEKRVQIIYNALQHITITDSKHNIVAFTVPAFNDSQLIQASVASYNSGLWPVYHFTKERGFDYSTTGKDYSADVLERQLVFEAIMDVL